MLGAENGTPGTAKPLPCEPQTGERDEQSGLDHLLADAIWIVRGPAFLAGFASALAVATSVALLSSRKRPRLHDAFLVNSVRMSLLVEQGVTERQELLDTLRLLLR